MALFIQKCNPKRFFGITSQQGHLGKCFTLSISSNKWEASLEMTGSRKIMCRQTKSDHVVLSLKSVSYSRWFLFRFSTNVPPSALPQRITDAAKSLERLGCSLSVSPGCSGYSVSEDIRPITRPAVHTANGSWCLSASQHQLLQQLWVVKFVKLENQRAVLMTVDGSVPGWRDSSCLFHHWANDTSNRLISCSFFFLLLFLKHFLQFTASEKKNIWIYKKWFAKSPLRTCRVGMSNFCPSVEPELSKCVYCYDCTVIWAQVLYRHVSGVHR